MWRFPCTELQFSFVRPLKKCWKCCGETKVLRNLLQDDKKPLFELYLSWGKMLVVHNHPLVVIPSQHTQTHNLKTTPDWPMSTHWLIKHDAASWHHYITGNKPLLLYFRPGSVHLQLAKLFNPASWTFGKFLQYLQTYCSCIQLLVCFNP